MKKRSLFGAAIALLLGAAGVQTSQPAPVASQGTTKTVQPTDSTSRTPKQAPAPATKAQQQMALRDGYGEPRVVRHFVERPGLRRVKYGRGKWIMLS